TTLFRSSHVDLALRPVRAAATPDGGAVELAWPDGHASRFATSWLAAHAYAPERSGGAAAARVDDHRVEPGPELAARCLARVAERGAAVVFGAGDDTEGLIAQFEALGLVVVPTHFGRIEDLRTDNTTNENTDQLGYTNAPVDLHTDQPFLERPPRYQALHCVRAADEGGASAIADAFAAARVLRDTAREDFDVLAGTPIVFDRRQKRYTKRLVTPVLEVVDDEPVRVRASYFTLGTPMLPFERMEAWYRAYARFVRLVNDERHRVAFRLEAGDFLLYDNFRMLHAREAFTGARWVRGIYFDPRA
ncbi:MAG: TauD/TfdA family dioxygenase, partial [Myxococcales bacterium]|nr:TauD/TfdA family dioxygenase [Myxococcales bacterium]